MLGQMSQDHPEPAGVRQHHDITPVMVTIELTWLIVWQTIDDLYHLPHHRRVHRLLKSMIIVERTAMVPEGLAIGADLDEIQRLRHDALMGPAPVTPLPDRPPPHDRDRQRWVTDSRWVLTRSVAKACSGLPAMRLVNRVPTRARSSNQLQAMTGNVRTLSWLSGSATLSI